MLEKMLSLSKKMDRDGDLKQWIFSSCQETEADLKIMEQGLFFIQSIQSSLLPDFLKNLMSGINTAIGNVATFDVFTDPVDGKVRIIDINYRNTL